MNPRNSLAALAVSGVLLTGLAGCGDDTEPASAPGTQSATESASEPAPADAPTTEVLEPTTSTPSTAPSPEPTTEPTVVPVYFTGDTPWGARLYREFRPVESDTPLEEAAALLLAGDALDPDYGTLLDGVTIDTVVQDADAIVVTLAEDSVLRPDKSTSRREARLAVQSLVYTLQGVAQERLPLRVRLADGTPTDLFEQPTGRGVAAAPQLDVLALVNLTSPEQGVTVSDTLAVQGVAASFEANVPFAVLDATGAEVLTGFATAEQFGDRLYPFSTEVDVSDLEAGDYTVVARTDDPSDGEGPGPFEDTKTITIG